MGMGPTVCLNHGLHYRMHSAFSSGICNMANMYTKILNHSSSFDLPSVTMPKPATVCKNDSLGTQS